MRGKKTSNFVYNHWLDMVTTKEKRKDEGDKYTEKAKRVIQGWVDKGYISQVRFKK